DGGVYTSWGAANTVCALIGFRGADGHNNLYVGGTFWYTIDRQGNYIPAAAITRWENFSADFNRDGFVNSQDFFAFMTVFFNHDAAADFNRDGIVNTQ